MKYKFIAVDIDGTLLNSKGELTPKTRKWIHRVWKDGILFAISTGRPIQGVMPLIEEIGLDLPLITYNGSMVLMANSKEIIYQRVMKPEAVREVYRLGEKEDLTMILWSENTLFTNRIDGRSKDYASLTGTPLQLVDSLASIEKRITKMLWYDEVDRIQQLAGSIPTVLMNKEVVSHTSLPYFLEFVDRQASKAIAIDVLVRKYGIKREEVMAIGDSYNDASMLEYAGLGVAMGNAPEKIKRLADVVTTGCDEEGVAHAIEKYIYGGLSDERDTDQQVL
ncbi:HAD family phosphatase [Alkalibacter rhizosphaerae]|uniref:HAD family phosphatase n=1 Tax=Alkalibacter rhizosphaerae TaxID=2815577 RepID=A0A974XH71_9FIRM|nr:Cof-type HAD-IIB family hydrolase [Alkalibacter rhizosphaerae]QSX08268.1 HAD family phosphatase [Alkalibacter rhizosphaerae]